MWSIDILWFDKFNTNSQKSSQGNEVYNFLPQETNNVIDLSREELANTLTWSQKNGVNLCAPAHYPDHPQQ